MSIELVMLSNHFILCHPLLLLLSIFPRIKVFSSELALHIRWTKDWSFIEEMHFLKSLSCEAQLCVLGIHCLYREFLFRVAFPLKSSNRAFVTSLFS